MIELELIKMCENNDWFSKFCSCSTMGISACEKCINKKDETQNKGKKWLNLASFFGQKSLKY